MDEIDKLSKLQDKEINEAKKILSYEVTKFCRGEKSARNSHDISENLFQNNMLFIDARAKQYYDNGHIPQAICNDDLDGLIDQILEKIRAP